MIRTVLNLVRRAGAGGSGGSGGAGGGVGGAGGGSGSVVNVEEIDCIREGLAAILSGKEERVFYNPIQQFNRDLSVMGIRAWSEWGIREKDGDREGETPKGRKRRKLDTGLAADEEMGPDQGKGPDRETGPDTEKREFRDHRENRENRGSGGNKVDGGIKILEALSATGLRAIRYAHEIPGVSKVVANDLLLEAVKTIDRNIECNKVGGKVWSHHGDAIKMMAGCNEKFHVIDLDPYGTATPFIDSAMQAIKDDGLLLVTCTDAGVLAGSGYPEKCFALYGGHNFGNSHVSGDANHEAGIRLILSMIATTAAKYKKSIEPLLSLSIDFYFRLFIRVKTSPIVVKELASKTMTTYYCNGCGYKCNQPLGRVSPKGNGKKFQVPKVVGGVSETCQFCDSANYVAGPMWAGGLHNQNFIAKVLQVNQASDGEVYGTKERIRGMLTLAQSELETPFYFNLNQVSSLFKAPPIPIHEFCKAVGNLGYNISLTHAKRNCIKTDAPWDVILAVNKRWLIDSNKVLLSGYEAKLAKDPQNEKLMAKIDGLKKNTATNPNLTAGMTGYKILQHLKDRDVDEIDFDTENDASTRVNKLRHLKLVRYQENPTKNWGPKARPGK